MASDQDSRGKLREEIIESEKMQSDILKWKLIAVAAIASVSLGFGIEGIPADPAKSNSYGSRWLLCLIPLMCAYVDLISVHYMLRIITIGAYLKSTGDPYETLMFSLRDQSGKNPFVFESRALQGSSIIFNFILVVVGFIMLAWSNSWDLQHKVGYIITGFLGIGFSAYLILVYPSLVDRIHNSITNAAVAAAITVAKAAADASDEAGKATQYAIAQTAGVAIGPALTTAAIAAANESMAAATAARAAAAVAPGPGFATATAAAARAAAASAARAAAASAARAAKATEELAVAVAGQPGVSPAIVANLAVATTQARTAAFAAATATAGVER